MTASEQQRRDHLRALSIAAWGDLDRRSTQRTAMLIAGFLLEEAGETGLAEYLLTARPERAEHVATMIAVHALRRGVANAWDALMVGNAADYETASLHYEAEATFTWLPEPGDLIEEV